MEVVIPSRPLRACGPSLRAAGPGAVHLEVEGEADARLRRPTCGARPLRKVEVINATAPKGRGVLVPHGPSFVAVGPDGRVLRVGGPEVRVST